MEAPAEEEVPVTPEQSGEHAAELTPNMALVQPIGGLAINTDTETLLPSPARRASPSVEVSPRSRHKLAMH